MSWMPDDDRFYAYWQARDEESEHLHNLQLKKERAMDDLKFCKDCRYLDADRCLHPKAVNERGADKFTDWLVKGEGERPPEIAYYYASIMRRYECGKEGKLFAPKVEQIEVKAA